MSLPTHKRLQNPSWEPKGFIFFLHYLLNLRHLTHYNRYSISIYWINGQFWNSISFKLIIWTVWPGWLCPCHSFDFSFLTASNNILLTLTFSISPSWSLKIPPLLTSHQWYPPNTILAFLLLLLNLLSLGNFIYNQDFPFYFFHQLLNLPAKASCQRPWYLHPNTYRAAAQLSSSHTACPEPNPFSGHPTCLRVYLSWRIPVA